MKNNKKTTKKFINNAWIAGKYCGYNFVGITTTLNKKPKALIVSELALTELIDFNLISDIKLLIVPELEIKNIEQKSPKKSLIKLTAMEKIIIDSFLNICLN